MKHIVAATDFSDASSTACSLAAKLAERFHASVSLVHAYDPTPLGPAQAHVSGPSQEGPQREKMAAGAQVELDKCRAEQFGAVDEVKIEVLESDSPALSICDHAVDREAELLVVGTHGRARLTRWLIGGVAEKIVRHASCTVLAVRGRLGSRGLPQHIVVGTDFSPAAESALDAAALWAERLGARVTLVYCYDTAFRLLPAFGAPETDTDSERLELAKADLREALASVARSKFANVKDARSELLVSRNPAASICSYADDHGAELIVVGAQGRTGHARVFIGGVAEKVLRHGSCSILTVRS